VEDEHASLNFWSASRALLPRRKSSALIFSCVSQAAICSPEPTWKRPDRLSASYTSFVAASTSASRTPGPFSGRSASFTRVAFVRTRSPGLMAPACSAVATE
jgi:hypothetical protein